MLRANNLVLSNHSHDLSNPILLAFELNFVLFEFCLLCQNNQPNFEHNGFPGFFLIHDILQIAHEKIACIGRRIQESCSECLGAYLSIFFQRWQRLFHRLPEAG